MAKIYGGRWKRIDDALLGKGGQSEVYRVVDQTSASEDQFALKRVLNPKRHQRFLNEIEAIKRLDHPNVIRLIDHSALENLPNEETKQYIVMPIALGKDLSDPNRLALYKNMIDSTLLVAKQITSALVAAHSNKIIHRDIKPQNILFTGNGNDVWVTDFGIALIQDSENRPTETGEVVGPWSFIAPELEFGGKLDVTPAADIYSLGKVIFYMLSGGTIIPREAIHEPYINEVFDGRGERYRRLKMLLSEMICPLANRLQDAAKVEQRLKGIEDYERQSSTLPISREGLTALAELQTLASDSTRVRQQSKANYLEEQRRLSEIQNSFMDAVRVKLSNMAADVNTPDLGATSEDVPFERGKFRVPISAGAMYFGICGVSMTLEFAQGQRAGRKHRLVFILCEKYAPTVTVRVGNSPEPAETVEPVRDRDLAILVCYAAQYAGNSNASNEIAYFNRSASIGRPARPNTANQRPEILRRTAKTFYSNDALHLAFKVSTWLDICQDFNTLLNDGTDAFFQLLKSPEAANRFL